MKYLYFFSSCTLALMTWPFRLLAETPTPTSLALPDANVALGSSSLDFTWLFLKMIFAMVFVIALAIVVIRFIIPKLTYNRGAVARSDLRIIDRIPLDARKSLYVLQVEDRRLLIGTSEHHVGFITELKPVQGND